MSLINKLWKIPFVVQSKIPFKLLPDRLYLSCTFRGLMNKKLNWNSPETFNEKLQLLKLKYSGPIYSEWVDKHLAKSKAASLLSKECIIPTIATFSDLEEFEKSLTNLPRRFVLKTTHNSGGVWIISEKNPYSSKIKKEIQKNLKENYYNQWREAPYKDVRPALIVEKYMGNDLKDYKLFCFHGKPEIILVCSERSSNLKEDFFDCSWNHLDMERVKHPNADSIPEKPKQLSEMISMAQKLSEPFEFVRVDLFEIDGSVYFGEMTFIPACGFEGFKPDSWDKKLGEWI